MTYVVAVVDDDHRVLESLADLLESAGHEVRLFPSAPALLQHCSFAEIDCLISDISMAVMDGLELQRLAHIARPELPVILITGRELTDQAMATTRGCCSIFRKPFNCHQLLAAISSALSASD
jgi:FixJ family two-component response regulator